MFIFSLIERFLIQTCIIFVNTDKIILFRVSCNRYQNLKTTPFNISLTDACWILWTNNTDIAVWMYIVYLIRTWGNFQTLKATYSWRFAGAVKVCLSLSFLVWYGFVRGDWGTSNDVLSQIKHRGHLPSANYLFFPCQTIIPAKASSFVTFFF